MDPLGYIISPTHTQTAPTTHSLIIHFSASSVLNARTWLEKLRDAFRPRVIDVILEELPVEDTDVWGRGDGLSPQKMHPGHQHSPWKIPVGRRRLSYWNDPFSGDIFIFRGVSSSVWWGCLVHFLGEMATVGGNECLQVILSCVDVPCWTYTSNKASHHHLSTTPGIIAPHHLTASQPCHKGVFPKMAVYNPQNTGKTPKKWSFLVF